MNELECYLAKDLLAGQLEGLNGPETTAAVEAHLQGCEGCRAAYEALRQPLENPKQTTRRTVRTLRKLKRRTVKAIAITAAALLALFGAVLVTCVVGFPVKSTEMQWNVVTDTQSVNEMGIPGGTVEVGPNGEISSAFKYQPNGFAACGIELTRPGKLSVNYISGFTETREKDNRVTSTTTEIKMRKMLNLFHFNGPPTKSFGALNESRHTFVLKFSDKDVVITFEDGKLMKEGIIPLL